MWRFVAHPYSGKVAKAHPCRPIFCGSWVTMTKVAWWLILPFTRLPGTPFRCVRFQLKFLLGSSFSPNFSNWTDGLRSRFPQNVFLFSKCCLSYGERRLSYRLIHVIILDVWSKWMNEWINQSVNQNNCCGRFFAANCIPLLMKQNVNGSNFGVVRGRNSPFLITLASGLYNSL